MWNANIETTNTGTVYLHVKDTAGNINYANINCTSRHNYWSWVCNKCGYYKIQGWNVGIGYIHWKCSCGFPGYNSILLESLVGQYIGCEGCGKTVPIIECGTIITTNSIATCSHGKTFSHYYCSHNNNGIYHIY